MCRVLGFQKWGARRVLIPADGPFASLTDYQRVVISHFRMFWDAVFRVPSVDFVCMRKWIE